MNCTKPFVAGLLCAAGCTAALSQTSPLEIYGIVDLGVNHTNGGTSTGALPGAGTADRTQVRSGQSSRIGFRGREDLGGGRYSRFLIEHRMNVDTGAQTSATLFWSGETLLAAGSSALGEVYTGRTYAPAYRVAGLGDPFGYNYAGQLGSRYTYAAHQTVASSAEASNIRYANAVGAKTASMGGFTVEAQVAAGEGVRKRSTGLNVIYAAGPVTAGLGYDALDSDNRLWVGVLRLKLGAFEPSLTYADNRGGLNGDAKSYALGLTAQAGSGTVLATAGRYDAANDANDSTMFGAGYRYPLSKRTALYATYGSGKRTDRSRVQSVEAGLNHRF